MHYSKVHCVAISCLVLTTIGSIEGSQDYIFYELQSPTQSTIPGEDVQLYHTCATCLVRACVCVCPKLQIFFFKVQNSALKFCDSIFY